MAGLRQLIKTNVIDAAGAQVTVKMLGDLVQSVFETGGLASGGQYAFIVSANQNVQLATFKVIRFVSFKLKLVEDK